MPGSLFLVATPIGNLEDITLRALKVLKLVDLIAAEDTRRTGHLLTHFAIATRTTSLHEHNEKHRVPSLVEQIRQGLNVAVVTDAGMPSVSDPGYLIVRETLAAGLKVEVVPGVSALTTALAGSGLPTEEFTFLGFAPSRSTERKRWLSRKLPGVTGTALLFEAPGRLQDLLRDLLVAWGDRQAVVAHELTKVHESWHRGLLSELTTKEGLEAIPARGEFVVLVSDQQNAVERALPLPSDAEVAAMFDQVSGEAGQTRRNAINRVAATYSLTSKAVYAIVEKMKVSGK